MSLQVYTCTNYKYVKNGDLGYTLLQLWWTWLQNFCPGALKTLTLAIKTKHAIGWKACDNIHGSKGEYANPSRQIWQQEGLQRIYCRWTDLFWACDKPFITSLNNRLHHDGSGMKSGACLGVWFCITYFMEQFRKSQNTAQSTKHKENVKNSWETLMHSIGNSATF